MNAKNLTIDDLAYLLISGATPASGRINGEAFTIDEIAEVFEEKREELDVGQSGDHAVSSDGRLKISFRDKGDGNT